ncbi:MAG: CpsD/CapB family tyrosine-protein kinase [Phycisphaerales bacterium JB063]
MGYIFDAISKQINADNPAMPTDEPTTQDATPDEPLLFPGAIDPASPPAEADAPAPLNFANDTQDTEPAPATAGIIVPMQAQPWWQFWRRDKAGKVDDRLVTKTSPASSMAEEYRSIRTSILARHQQERNIVHTITSATPQEGKTITCVNLGLAFAELRNRTTIILECDLRLPTFEKLLRLDHKAGLIPYLRGECTLDQAICKLDQGGLHVITAGDRVSDEAVQLLSSPRMARLIQALRAKFDHVIIDTPPVLELADAGILGAQSDEVLLVARMRRTPRPLIEQAVRTLTSYNAEVHGMIATDNPRTRGRGYGYKYGYHYGYHYAYTDGKTPSRRRSRRAA